MLDQVGRIGEAARGQLEVGVDPGLDTWAEGHRAQLGPGVGAYDRLMRQPPPAPARVRAAIGGVDVRGLQEQARDAQGAQAGGQLAAPAARAREVGKAGVIAHLFQLDQVARARGENRRIQLQFQPGRGVREAEPEIGGLAPLGNQQRIAPDGAPVAVTFGQRGQAGVAAAVGAQAQRLGQARAQAQARHRQDLGGGAGHLGAVVEQAVGADAVAGGLAAHGGDDLQIERGQPQRGRGPQRRLISLSRRPAVGLTDHVGPETLVPRIQQGREGKMRPERPRGDDGAPQRQRAIAGDDGAKVDLTARIGQALLGRQRVGDCAQLAAFAQIVAALVGQAGMTPAAGELGLERLIGAPRGQALGSIEIRRCQGQAAPAAERQGGAQRFIVLRQLVVLAIKNLIVVGIGQGAVVAAVGEVRLRRESRRARLHRGACPDPAQRAATHPGAKRAGAGVGRDPGGRRGLRGQRDDAAHRRGAKAQRARAAVDLDAAHRRQGHQPEIHRAHHRAAQGHAIGVDCHLVGRRSAQRQGRQRSVAAVAGDRHAGQFTEQLRQALGAARGAIGGDDRCRCGAILARLVVEPRRHHDGFVGGRARSPGRIRRLRAGRRGQRQGARQGEQPAKAATDHDFLDARPGDLRAADELFGRHESPVCSRRTGQVSWLEGLLGRGASQIAGSGLPGKIPVASGGARSLAYSGGTAPEFHRLPSSQSRIGPCTSFAVFGFRNASPTSPHATVSSAGAPGCLVRHVPRPRPVRLEAEAMFF